MIVEKIEKEFPFLDQKWSCIGNIHLIELTKNNLDKYRAVIKNVATGAPESISNFKDKADMDKWLDRFKHIVQEAVNIKFNNFYDKEYPKKVVTRFFIHHKR